VTLWVVVAGAPVGKNQSKGFHKGRFYVPRETKLWQRRIAVAAWIEGRRVGWPDPFAVAEASYYIRRYNVRGDSDRGNTYLVDALQFTRWWTPRGESGLAFPIGIAGDDRDLWCAGSPPSITDGGAARVEVEVVLRGLRAPHEAARLRDRWFAGERRRFAKKGTSTAKRIERVARATKRSELDEIRRRTGLELPLS
jgi:hypothetical protein